MVGKQVPTYLPSYLLTYPGGWIGSCLLTYLRDDSLEKTAPIVVEGDCVHLRMTSLRDTVERYCVHPRRRSGILYTPTNDGGGREGAKGGNSEQAPPVVVQGYCVHLQITGGRREGCRGGGRGVARTPPHQTKVTSPTGCRMRTSPLRHGSKILCTSANGFGRPQAPKMV